MKKFAVVLMVAFVVVILVSSCQKKTCPAYSKATVENYGTRNG